MDGRTLDLGVVSFFYLALRCLALSFRQLVGFGMDYIHGCVSMWSVHARSEDARLLAEFSLFVFELEGLTD